MRLKKDALLKKAKAGELVEKKKDAPAKGENRAPSTFSWTTSTSSGCG
jgi:hypothetical protein